MSNVYDVKLEIKSDIILSPFSLQDQIILAVPTDLPDINSPDGKFDEATADIVSEMSGVVGGGLFVLFTSHRALRRVAEILRAESRSDFPLFVLGEEARSRLLEGFIHHGSGILYGASYI